MKETLWGVVAACLLVGSPAVAETYKPNILDPTYEHDKWGTKANCMVTDFAAYRSCFDSPDDNDEDGIPDAWGVPLYVAYEIKKFDGACVKTFKRPNEWITDITLPPGIMPTDDSYDYSQAFRKKHRDWFVRGHLAAKVHAERVSPEAAWNAHTFYNAVPQRQSFNAGIWLDLENLTAAWAQHYGRVWVITGPIFADRYPFAYLGRSGTFPVAVPEALFKIVIKMDVSADQPNVLAFIYPQIGASYLTKPYIHNGFLTTVDEIEKFTGIDFLTALPSAAEKTIEKHRTSELWDAEKSDHVKACTSETP